MGREREVPTAVAVIETLTSFPAAEPEAVPGLMPCLYPSPSLAGAVGVFGAQRHRASWGGEIPVQASRSSPTARPRDPDAFFPRRPQQAQASRTVDVEHWGEAQRTQHSSIKSFTQSESLSLTGSILPLYPMYLSMTS